MRLSFLSSLICLGVLCGTAHAEVTFEIIGPSSATDVSADGSVVVGNTLGEYETFRWTEEDGIVPLGRATVPVLGVGAGTPDVSADGTKVSAMILSDDETFATQGLWTLGSGWEQLMPPTPPDGGLMDNSLGSAWGLSGDGQTVVGLYWRPGHAETGSAHPSRWWEETGVVDLGTDGVSGRANAASYDGSVIVGWTENPSFGNWWPTVWAGSERTILNEVAGSCMANSVTSDGSMIVGSTWDDEDDMSVAAAWRWNGSTWDEEALGAIPGTFPFYGYVIANDVTADGSTVVGYNELSGPGDATGFIWTEESGMIDVDDFLADNGVEVDPTLSIRTLTSISYDGTAMVGIGQDIYPPWNYRSFIIRMDNPMLVAGPEDVVLSMPSMQAFPNPTSGATTLMLDLPQSTQVSLEIHDITGRLVRKLSGGSIQAGHHQVRWDGTDASGTEVPSGVYYCRFTAGTQAGLQKITIMR